MVIRSVHQYNTIDQIWSKEVEKRPQLNIYNNYRLGFNDIVLQNVLNAFYYSTAYLSIHLSIQPSIYFLIDQSINLIKKSL